MGDGGGVSRGDRDRNARLERLRALVPVTDAIAGVGLAGGKQMVVVADHDWKGHRAADVPVPCLGSGLGAGLGGWPGCRPRVGWGEGVV